MSDNKPKKIDKFIKAIGGKTNGIVETWVFTTSQLWKIFFRAGWIIVSVIGLIIAFSTQINTFKGIPFRLNFLESSERELTKKVDKNTMNISHIKEDTAIIRGDLRFIKGLLLTRGGGR